VDIGGKRDTYIHKGRYPIVLDSYQWNYQAWKSKLLLKNQLHSYSHSLTLFRSLLTLVLSLLYSYSYTLTLSLTLLLSYSLTSLLPCFLASLLPSLLPCFLASLLPCFLASFQLGKKKSSPGNRSRTSDLEISIVAIYSLPLCQLSYTRTYG